MSSFRRQRPFVIAITLLALFVATALGQARLPKPDEGSVGDARTKVRELFAKDYRDAKNAEGKWKLAEQMAKRAADAKESPINRFGLFCEARDLYTQVGDMLSAFRTVDDMAKAFELSAFQEKIDLVQRVFKQVKTPPQHRSIAIAALKLAGDAAEFEEYDVAKECCNTAVAASRSSQDPALQTRALDELKRYEQLLSQWQSATQAQKTLKDDPTDTAASLSLGRFRCFVHRDWATGLPLLRQSSDTELAALATSDLRAPTDAKEQTALATDWLKYAQKQKDATDRAAAAERSAYWFENTLKSVAGLDRVPVETQLETAYELSCGRNFKKLLSRTPNGVESESTVDCQKKTHPLKLKAAFDLRKSWLLSLEFTPRGLDDHWHQVFFWGDGQPGHDPIGIFVAKDRILAEVDDCVLNRRQGLKEQLPTAFTGESSDVKFVYDALAGEFELYVNHRLVRRETAAITPTADRRKPLFLGGTNSGGYRFGGSVRKVWLGNIP